MLSPRLHRRTTWLALLAMLALALLPAISRAVVAAQGGGDWVEVCSVKGTRWVSMSTGEEGEPALKPLSEACPYCQLQTEQPGLPPVPAPDWRAPEAVHEQPPAFWQAPRLLAIWRRASTRGPPLHA